MITQEVLTVSGEPKGLVELSAAVFGLKARRDLLWEATTVHLANQRQGTAATKTRAEVSGGGKKPWRQKHTGRARHGSIRSPIWRHGGIVFGPRPRDYSKSLPARKRTKALCMALSAVRAENRMRVVEDFELASPKTKELQRILSGLGIVQQPVLLVTDQPSATLKLAARNIPKLDLMRARDLNAYEVLRHQTLVITEGALNQLTARLVAQTEHSGVQDGT